MKRVCGFVFSVLLLPSVIDTLDIDFDLKEKFREVLKDCRLALTRPCPDESGFVKFHLFTRKNREASQLVEVEARNDNLRKTFFNQNHPNKIIIHGFNPRLYRTELKAVKDAFLARDEANVWMVNWSKLAHGGKCIAFSLRNTDHVARCTAQLIEAIARRAPQSDIHVIADRAGNRVAHRLALEIAPRKLPRITGLNPEGGIVPTGNDVNKLTFWDAEFVDTIHSLPFMPSSDMFGHIDFYVNPGKLHQPGCEKEEGKFVCDQRRAIQYFAESVSTKVGFLAWECSSYSTFALGVCNPPPAPHPPPVIMGDSCPNMATGTYIVYTAKETPYALGYWEGALYKEKGPQKRVDKISKYATQIKRQIELIEGSAPQILKESGVLDLVTTKLNLEAGDLRSAAIDLGLRGIKALADRYLSKRTNEAENMAQDAEKMAQDTEKMAQDAEKMAQDINNVAQGVIENIANGMSENSAQEVTDKIEKEIDKVAQDVIGNVAKDVSEKAAKDETEKMVQETASAAEEGEVGGKDEAENTAQDANENVAKEENENVADVTKNTEQEKT